MHPKYLGDSYDLVKRFFCVEIATLGYSVEADPMADPSSGLDIRQYCRLIGATSAADQQRPVGQRVLLLDPDTGVQERPGPKHVTFVRLANEADRYDVLLCFDQAFSRGRSAESTMTSKIAALRQMSCAAMYYSSHAHFLFVSRSMEKLIRIRDHLVEVGVPAGRLIL